MKNFLNNNTIFPINKMTMKTSTEMTTRSIRHRANVLGRKSRYSSELSKKRKNKEIQTKSREHSRKIKAVLLSATPSEFEYNEEGCWYEIESNITNEEHQEKVNKSIEYIERLQSEDYVVLDDDDERYFYH